MQIYIRYTENYGELPNGIETINIPLSNEFEQTRVNFKCLEDNHWAFLIEHKVLDKVKLTYSWKFNKVYEILLKSDTECNAQDYYEWLTKYIEYIEVDGHEFWTNPQLQR